MQAERPTTAQCPTTVAWSGLVALMLLAALAATPGPTLDVLAVHMPHQHREVPREPEPAGRLVQSAAARVARDLIAGSSVLAAARTIAHWESGLGSERFVEPPASPASGRVRVELLNIPPPAGVRS